MKYKIHKVVVIGAGTMGGGIAAHLANAGVPVTLLDIVPWELSPDEIAKGLTMEDKVVRNRIVGGILTGAIYPDTTGVNQGVTTVVDGGAPARFTKPAAR